MVLFQTFFYLDPVSVLLIFFCHPLYYPWQPIGFDIYFSSTPGLKAIFVFLFWYLAEFYYGLNHSGDQHFRKRWTKVFYFFILKDLMSIILNWVLLQFAWCGKVSLALFHWAVVCPRTVPGNWCWGCRNTGFFPVQTEQFRWFVDTAWRTLMAHKGSLGDQRLASSDLDCVGSEMPHLLSIHLIVEKSPMGSLSYWEEWSFQHKMMQHLLDQQIQVK